MTAEIAICLSIIAVAIVLFASDRVPADVVALGVMLALVLTGLLQPETAFRGFASDTVMMILGLLIMTAGLVSTGVVDEIGRGLLSFTRDRPAGFLPVIMITTAALSAFISNTAATALFVPLVLGYAARSATSPSLYLLPLAFSAILASSVTLISTSTNLVVSEVLVEFGQPAMGMFELAPAGIPIAIVGLIYTWLFAGRMLSASRQASPDTTVGERKYQADVVVLPDSALSGKLIGETRIGPKYGLEVVKLNRGGVTSSNPDYIARARLEAGDELVIEGLRADVLQLKSVEGVEFTADVHLASPATAAEELAIVEGVILPGSPLISRSLSGLNFKDRYGLQVLAIHRAGRLPAKMSRTRLRLGDVLLLQGTRDNVKALERGNLFSIFGGIDQSRLNLGHAPIAAIIFAGAIAAGSAKIVALPVAMLLGALLMLATRCLSPEDAYRQIEWKILVLIGSLLSLGAAMDSTGAGRYLAALLLELAGTGNTLLLLSLFFVMTVLLTQPMSNQAAAIVLLPIALETAGQMDANPRAFAMMIAIAASCSYLTPLEPACLLVYGPGHYRFADFLRVGLPLTVLVYLLAIVLVPIVWPL